MPAAVPLRLGTLNLASGRDRSGRPLSPADLASALAGLDVDLLAVQEVDICQPRSSGVDQADVVAGALGAEDWRAAATLNGTPGPFRTWRPAEPVSLRGPGPPPAVPQYGIALLSRVAVHRWSVLPLGTGRGRLPVRAPDPRTGRTALWWVPDEPRAAIAAELDGVTVVATHLSFAPVTASRQLYRLRDWAARLPPPVVLAGDLNVPGAVAGRLIGARPLVRATSYPADRPRVQLDHVLALGPLTARSPGARRLPFGDHLLLTAELLPG